MQGCDAARHRPLALVVDADHAIAGIPGQQHALEQLVAERAIADDHHPLGVDAELAHAGQHAEGDHARQHQHPRHAGEPAERPQARDQADLVHQEGCHQACDIDQAGPRAPAERAPPGCGPPGVIQAEGGKHQQRADGAQQRQETVYRRGAAQAVREVQRAEQDAARGHPDAVADAVQVVQGRAGLRGRRGDGRHDSISIPTVRSDGVMLRSRLTGVWGPRTRRALGRGARRAWRARRLGVGSGGCRRQAGHPPRRRATRRDGRGGRGRTVDCDVSTQRCVAPPRAGTGKVCNAVKAASAAASGTTLRGRAARPGQARTRLAPSPSASPPNTSDTLCACTARRETPISSASAMPSTVPACARRGLDEGVHK